MNDAPPDLARLPADIPLPRIVRRDPTAAPPGWPEAWRLTLRMDPETPEVGLLRVYRIAPPRAPRLTVLYSHGGSIRPDPVVGSGLWRALLAEAGRRDLPIRFVAVDHRGARCEEAKQRFTLADRVNDLAIARALAGDDAPLALMGNSMGGHVALMAARSLGVRRLALVNPGVYGAAAHDVPLGPRFSAAIRAPGSWHASPAFDALAALLQGGGRAIMLASRADTVIPDALNAKLEQTIVRFGGPRGCVKFSTAGHTGMDPSVPGDLLDFLSVSEQ
ncbi:MAG: alpha/beta hydrolase [Alphaproteobacteria bacterium]|nr:alpha/beta hydrolase [Alphaproteobacteria bacterium]